MTSSWGGLVKVTEDDGRGEGVRKPRILDDVICEHSLIVGKCHFK